jgi:hypothetical protein
VRLQFGERTCGELDGGIRPDRPVRHKQRAGTRVKERPRQTG